jgi:hypothetical protein
MCSIVSLSSHHILHLFFSPSIQYVFSLSWFPRLNLAIIFLSLALSLSPQLLRNFLCHTPLILLVVSGFFDPSLLSCLSVSLSFSLSSTSIHPPFALNLSTFSLAFLFSLSFSLFFFFCLQHSVSILHASLPSSFLSPNFAALFPTFTLSLFLLYPPLPM